MSIIGESTAHPIHKPAIILSRLDSRNVQLRNRISSPPYMYVFFFSNECIRCKHPRVWSPRLHATHATTRTQSHAHMDGSPFGGLSGRGMQKRNTPQDLAHMYVLHTHIEPCYRYNLARQMHTMLASHRASRFVLAIQDSNRCRCASCRNRSRRNSRSRAACACRTPMTHGLNRPAMSCSCGRRACARCVEKSGRPFG